MTDKGIRTLSRFRDDGKQQDFLGFPESAVGQNCPQHYPQSEKREDAIANRHVLGTPMNITAVAALFGCSAWTIRQRYLPQGLPHVRASASGKIVFFREQVIDWILKRQQKKGGNRP